MASNYTPHDLPPLPQYTLKPLPPLLPFASDVHWALALPVIAYWLVSAFFHVIDVFDIFPQYRLHTPKELLKRNHATRWDVFRDVIFQQFIQTIFGLGLNYFEPEPMYGKEQYDVAVLAQRIRILQRGIPVLFGLLGVNSGDLGKRLGGSTSMLAGALAGGIYPELKRVVHFGAETVVAPAFASWEIQLAKLVYYIAIPAIQFFIAIVILDTWQYFLHRGMHMSPYLYTTLHSRHHRLYVPYAYGALYNHPIEGFALDTLGTGIAYLLTGMTVRQSMLLFTFCTIKTVDDHCGYALPLDPLQHLTRNNAAYHDIHHQSWGIKTNFSQPFFTFWDARLGTMWKGTDLKLRYERAREAADRWWEMQRRKAAGEVVAEGEAEIEADGEDSTAKNSVMGVATAAVTTTNDTPRARRSGRKASNNNSAQLKGLKDRMVNGAVPNGVPRVESNR